MAYTQDTYLLQASFTGAQIDDLIEDGYKAYDRFAEAYLNYSNEVTKPATFTVYGGSYTMKNSEVPVVIDAATTNMTISSVLRDGTYYNENTSFALTATDFINNGTLNISKAAEDESDYFVTFTSNATFTNNNSVSVSNAIFEVENVVNSATGTFSLTDGAAFAATTVTNSGTFNLTGDAMFDAATVTNSGTINLTDAGFGADVANTGAIYVYGKTTEIEGKFTGSGSINYMAGTSGEKKGAQKNKITGGNTINFLTQTDGNRRFFTASDFDVEGTEINIVGTSVSFSGKTSLTADELNVTSFTNAAETKTYAGAVKITGRTNGELIAKDVSLNIGNLNGEITLTDVAIKNSTISENVLGENNASLVMKDAVSISGENVFNANIANSGALSIAGSEDVPTSLVDVQELTNSGSGKVTIDGKAGVTVASIVNKNAGLITVSNGATLNAGSISNKKAGTYVQTIAVEGGTLIAGSVNTTGANFNVTGESKLEIGKDDDAAGLTGTITLGDATLADSFVKGGVVNVEGTVTLSGVNTLSDITNNSSLTLADGATLNASSLTLTAGSSITYNTTAKTINVTGAFDSSEVTSLLQFRNADFTAGSVNAKILKFVGSDITVNGTLTATTVTVQSASSVNVGKLDGILSLTSNAPTATSTISNSKVNTLDGSKDSGSVEITNNVVFDGTNVFNTAITNKGNATVSGSLTAGDITNSAGATLTVAGSLTANSITNSENATFTVSAAETELNIGKFTGTITFADGATLGDSSFGAGSVITANGSDFLATSATKLDLVASKDNVVLTIAPDNGQLTKGAITINGEFGENDPQMIQVISGKVVESEDLTITCKVDGYNKFVSDNGVYLVKGMQPATSIAVNTAWKDDPVDTLVTDEAGNSYIIGYNAFSTFTGALSAASKLTEASEITLLSDVTEEGLETPKYEFKNSVTVKGEHSVTWKVATQTGDDGSVYFFGKKNTPAKITFEVGTVFDSKGCGPNYIGYNPQLDIGPESRMDAEFNGTIQNSGIYVNRWSTLTVTGTVIGGAGSQIYVRKHSKLTIIGKTTNDVQVSTAKEALIYGGTTSVLNSVVSIGTQLKVSNRNVLNEADYNMPAETTVFGATNSTISADSFDGNIVGTETNGDAKDGVTSLVKSTMTIKNDVKNFGTFYVGVAVKAKDIVEEGKVVKNTVEVDDTVTDTASTLTLTEGSLNNYGTVKAKSSTIDVATGDVVNQGATKYVVTYDFAKKTNYQVKFFSGDEVKLTKNVYSNKALSSCAWMITEGDLDAGTYTVKVFKGEDQVQEITDQTISYNDEAAISLDASTLTADTITNNGAITVTNSTLNARVVDTSAEGAKFTVGGTSTLNISGTSSSLTGTITLAGGANVKATIAKGGTLDVVADTTATLAAGTSVASAITNAGALNLNGVTKTGKITNKGTVSGSASTVGGITNNAGSVTLTGKSFSSVSVKAGAVTLNPEDTDTKAIAVGSITNGTKGTKTAEAINGTFTANGNVTGSGAITNYAGSINVTGDLTLTPNKTTGLRPAITNGSIYTSGTTVRVGVGTLSVGGDLTAGEITNYHGANASGGSSIEVTGDLVAGATQMIEEQPVFVGAAIMNGTELFASTSSEDKAFITANNITAASITNYGTVGTQDTAKPQIVKIDLTGALVNKKYGEVFAGTLNAASIENEGGIDVGAINITSEAGTFVNEAGAEAIVGSNVSAKAITNNGYLQTGEEGTITATALTNGAYNATTGDGFIEAGSIEATGDIDNAGQVTVSGNISGASISNAGSIEAGSIEATAITNGIAATTDPVAPAVEGTIDAGSIAATGDIVNNAGSVTVSGKISGASISNAGTINAGSIEVGKAAVGTTPAVAGYINNSGTIQGVLLTPATEEAPATYGAVAISAIGTNSVILNTGSISAVNVTAATVTTNAAGASFNVSGTSTLNITKKLTGTITLADKANVTAMVKGGTLDVENGSIVSLVGEAGNTAAVTNLGKLTIAGGVIGAVTNKQVVVDETTVSGTLTVAAADGADAIQTGAFVNNADVNVKSEFTVKGNFTNSGTITIDASQFVLGDDNTVKVISVTGTLTNNGDIVVENIPEEETRQVFVKNDGDNKGVYLFGGKADMSELLVYSDLANEYAPGESFSFAGHGYVYAVNAFTSANAITQIADNTAYIHFVPQEEAYGNLNLNLSATQDLTVDMINATGRLVAGTFNFNNLIIASEVTEPNDDDEGITAGSIEFVNDVATGTNATVSIAAATAVFEGADFSESKSVTIQEEADVTFKGAFSAKATTINDSVVFIEDEEGAATISGKATVTKSIVGFSGAASFADAATFTDSTVGFSGATFTAANTTGKATVTFSGSNVGFAGDANFINEDVEGLVNVAITNSTVTFGGKATVEGALTLSGSEVDFDGVSTVGGLLKFTGSTVTVNGKIEAGSTSLDKNSALEIAEGASATLGNTTGNGKINMDVSSTLEFSPTTFSGTIDVDVTGLTATTTVAPATITGITEALRNNNLTISGKNASNNWAKYFKYDEGAKTLTLIKEATNVITATGNTNITKALNYSWTGSDEEIYYADNVVIQGGATSTLYLQGNGSYVTLDGGSTVGIYGGKYTEATTDRAGVNLGGDINIAIERGTFTKVVVGGDRINVASGRAIYYRENEDGLASINLTIDGGTFENYVATGVLYQGVNLQGSVEVGSTNLKINGGSFTKDVYGGNYGNKKSSSSCTFVESSNVTLTVGGAEKINMTGCLFVGSFGSGKVETTKLTLAGQSDAADALVVKEIWGGCGSDYNKDDDKGGTTYETAVSGSRTLSFTGFQAAINSRLVSGFSDVEVLSNGKKLVDEDRFDTKATLQKTVKLSDVENWTFEAGSTLKGAFINDFAGDTLTLKGIGDYFEATGLDSWTLFDDTTNFAGFDSFKKDFVKFDGDIATFTDGAWVAGDYKLSIDENNAMVLSRPQLA